MHDSKLISLHIFHVVRSILVQDLHDLVTRESAFERVMKPELRKISRCTEMELAHALTRMCEADGDIYHIALPRVLKHLRKYDKCQGMVQNCNQNGRKYPVIDTVDLRQSQKK